MFGNSMFGHHLHTAGHNPSFGSSGFGHQQENGAFGSTKKGHTGAFGQTNSYMDPNGMMHHAYDGMHHGNTGILRQNSLLGEMTQSKAERAKGVRPWAFSSISFPVGQHDGSIFSTAYEKPLEQPKPRPKLQRQQTFSMADSVERKHAPSFSSDPAKMRGRTFSAASLPSVRPKVTRSLSIAEDITEPVNMDIAAPFLRRQQSLDIEKARRKSLPKKHLINPLTILKHRRSSKVKEDDKSETVSLQTSTRSRSNTVESHRSSKSSTGSQKQIEISTEKPDNVTKRSEQPKTTDVNLEIANTKPETVLTKSPNLVSKPSSASEEEKLILSLMNPEVPEDNVFEPLKEPEEPMVSATVPIESPTIISKRIHEQRTPEEADNVGLWVPKEATVQRESKPIRKSKSPSRSPVLLVPKPVVYMPKPDPIAAKPVIYRDPTDSENSDEYYDCNNESQRNSPASTRNQPLKMRKKSAKKPRNTCSSSTCTDGEDTTSTCETPPRSTFRTNDTTDIHEADTLKVRDRGRLKERPTLKRLTNNDKVRDKHVEDHKRPSAELLVVPSYAPVVKGDPGSKENINNETADSSESGYATSYIPTSPKNYDHYKVSQFVNSLPNYPDIDEQRSECSRHESVLNGSETESDLDDTVKPIYPQPDLELTHVNCESGSDSETESVKTDLSVSKLEVMKLLESPTDVRDRVTNGLKEKSNGKPHAHFDNVPEMSSTKLRKDSTASETELLKFVKSEENDDSTDGPSEKMIKEKHVEMNSVVVANDLPQSESAETKLLNQPEKPSFVTSMIDRLSFRREYSSIYQSKSTNCVDALLHFLNLLLFLSSAGVVGIGIWLHLKDFNVNDITIILGNNLLQVIVYVAIAGAGVSLLAAMCLCCGIRQDKSGLGFYAFVLIAVIIAFITSAVLSTVFADKLKGIEFKFNFKDRLVTMYGVEGNVKNQFFTSAWDNMQNEFECCGGDGNGNGTDSWALYRRSAWFLEHADKGKVFVPESCCKENSNIQICQGGDHDLLGPPRYAPPKKLQKYYQELNPNLNPNGCYTSFASYLSKMSMYIALVCGGLAGLYFLTVMLTWVFCFKKSQDFSDSFMDDSYYDIEENDDVFNSTEGNLVHKDKQTNPATEETKFINTPFKSSLKAPENTKEQTRVFSTPLKSSGNAPAIILNGNVKLRDNVDNKVVTELRGAHRHFYDQMHEDTESSDSDDETESGRSTPQEVIDRRNMWLSSASTAGHLLSIAIEEEDSNFEDSDDETQKFSANV